MISKIKVVPSIASSNLINVERELTRIGMSYDNLHIDIEDGNFIPNISFGMSMIKSIRLASDKPFSVHLMVSDPTKYLDDLSHMNCSHIFIHVENQLYHREILYMIRSLKIKAGIALNPVSNIMNFEYLLDDVDCIMYLTSEPDGRDQVFNKKILDKVKIYPNKEIWIDGGVKIDMLPELEKVGVTTVVLGRQIFGNDNPSELLRNINDLHTLEK